MLQQTTSLREAIRPRSLFASALPVLITLALLRISHGISVLRLDALSVVTIAMLVQALANLNSIHSTFHRAFQAPPTAPVTGDRATSETPTDNNKIVINLMSQKLQRLWSWALFVLIMALLAIVRLSETPGLTIHRRQELPVTGGYVLLGVLAFLYCRHPGPLGPVGLQELVASVAFGPVAMYATAHLLVGTLPWSVILYAHVVLFLVLAFQILQSVADAPFAHRFGHAGSLALTLGYERSYQAFIVLTTLAYGLLTMFSLVLGHLPNLALLVTMSRVKDITDALREDELRGLAERFGRLGAVLGSGMVLSIGLSSFIV